MGGYGSGGWNAAGEPTTADLPRLDVNRLNKSDTLKQSSKSIVSWRLPSSEINMSIKVAADRINLQDPAVVNGAIDVMWFTWEPCRFGGRCPFFLCPDCGKRVLHLYRLGHFACRTCHDLSYPSQRERESDRAQRRANRTRMRLGGEPRWQSIPPRPKGMHRRTYGRWVDKIQEDDDITSRHLSHYI